MGPSSAALPLCLDQRKNSVSAAWVLLIAIPEAHLAYLNSYRSTAAWTDPESHWCWWKGICGSNKKHVGFMFQWKFEVSYIKAATNFTIYLNSSNTKDKFQRVGVPHRTQTWPWWCWRTSWRSWGQYNSDRRGRQIQVKLHQYHWPRSTAEICRAVVIIVTTISTLIMISTTATIILLINILITNMIITITTSTSHHIKQRRRPSSF